jgi:hypothetical protein
MGLIEDPYDGKYKDLPEEVRKVFTEQEFTTLVEIQKAFKSSIEYANYIFRGDDLEGNLQYIVHDWVGDPHRNDWLVKQLLEMQSLLERVEKEKERKEEATDAHTGKDVLVK